MHLIKLQSNLKYNFIILCFTHCRTYRSCGRRVVCWYFLWKIMRTLLGFYIESGISFRFSIKDDLCSFFAGVNSVLSCLSRPRENVLVQLLYSNCIPRLTWPGFLRIGDSDRWRCETPNLSSDSQT